MLPDVVTYPVLSPVTLVELKAHLRVVSSAEDDVLQSMIDRAVSHLDGYGGRLGRAIMSQTWRQDFEGWTQPLTLRARDAGSVVLSYIDADDALQTVDVAEYEVLPTFGVTELRPLRGFSYPSLADRARPISATFETGYDDPADVPASLKGAIMMLAGHMYEQREAS